MGFIREDKTNGNNNGNNEIKTISSKVLVTVPASNIKLNKPITVNNITLNKDRRYYIEFLGSKKLCSVMIRKDMGNSIICSIKDYVIQAMYSEQSTNLLLLINNTNAENIPISTNLVIYEEQVKYLDSKYLETDLTLQNSISMGRIGNIGMGSVALGAGVEASGSGSFAEGYHTTASGYYLHAEGYYTTASSNYGAHAEGYYTTASGDSSHAEGDSSTASGDSSHAEGVNTTASGYSSHAEGYYTTASSENQHVQGRYNIEDTANKYAHIVGNGEDGKMSNAHTLDWQGNGWYSGEVYVGGKSQDDGKKLLSTADIYFDENGKLCITINGVTKKFTPDSE